MWIDSHCHLDAPEFDADRVEVIARARAALAQPEAVGPTDDELDELWAEIDGGGAIWAWQPYARAVLARWGSPNPTTATTPTP